jgi:hypothetical protein
MKFELSSEDIELIRRICRQEIRKVLYSVMEQEQKIADADFKKEIGL